MPSAKNSSDRQLRAELKLTQARLAESEATLQAIRAGDVDAIVVDGPQGSRVFSLQTPEEPYRILAERMNEGAATLTDDGTILFCNLRLAEMARLPSERILGSSLLSLLHAGERENLRNMMRQALQEDVRAEVQLLRSDGAMLPAQFSLSAILLEESRQGLCLVATDLSKQKVVEHALRLLSACNALLVRTNDEPTLLQQICDLVVDVGGYRMAWVGYAEHDEKKTVRPIAESGFGAGYLDTVNVTWADEERGRGPTGTAIRTGNAAACHDVTSDLHFHQFFEVCIGRSHESWGCNGELGRLVRSIGGRDIARYGKNGRTLFQNSR
jgi:PAS domain S-box-containing protein